MKDQELKTKTSAQTQIYKIFLQRYQVYQGRLLASFQDDAKYEHVGVAKATSTNTVNTVCTPVSTASSSGGPSYPDLTNYADQDDSQIPDLKDIYDNPNDGIFTNASYDDE
ncbi:hypothetical protein Tco_0023053, partial [Tanacetum coccineum]